MHRLLLRVLLFALCFGFAYGSELALYEAVVGQPPAPRKLKPEEKQYWAALVKAGLVPKAPETVRDPTPIKINKLSEQDTENFLKSLAIPIENLPPPRNAIREVSVGTPNEELPKGEKAHVRCIFEVDPTGSVGRVFSTEWSSESYFQKAAEALKGWKFKPENQTRYFKIVFEAEFERK